MKKDVIVLIVLILAGGAWGLESPVKSPIGSPTQVPSAGNSGLIPSRPETAGNYGNQIVTGNVGGGRHFRGVVPYGSSYYSDPAFGTSSGSVAVSDFIRRSSGYEPFYDPRRTATTLVRDGGSGLRSPVITGQAAAAANPSQAWLNSFDLTRAITPPQQTTPLVEREINPYLKDHRELPDETIVVEPVKPESTEGVPEDALTVPRPKAELTDTPEAENLYDRIRRELMKEEEEAARETAPERSEDEGPAQEAQPQSSEARLAQAEAPRLRREFGSFRNLAQVRYHEYMSQGQKLMRQGEFYKAADAFELANVWDPQSALAMLGRSHALFGAGEYMSSAYYLHQAINSDAALARVRIRLDALIGGRDLYETRVSELTNWQMRSQSGELSFLTSYVMLMDGKTQRALDLAEQAAGKMPESKAVEALQAAIANPATMIEAPVEAAP